MFMWSESKRRGRKVWSQQNNQRKSGWNSTKFGKIHKSADSRSWVNPKRINPKKFMPRHIMIKLQKTKGKKKLWKQWERNNTIYYISMWKTIQITVNFSSKTMEARRKWRNIFQVLKEKNCWPRILHPVKISLENGEGNQNILDEGKLW